MKIDINLLKEKKRISFNEKINMSNRETNDALIKQINYIDANVEAYMLSGNEISITANYTANVDYLDARTLRELHLEFSYDDDLLFTTNYDKSIELEIDYVSDVIDLDELLFELTLVSLPLNYSEDKNEQVIKESDMKEEVNRPFEEIFKNK